MAENNVAKAQNVGQGAASQDITQEYDKHYGMYDGSKGEGGKPTDAGPGPLTNTPSPFKLTGG